jgi:hypothetical protein
VAGRIHEDVEPARVTNNPGERILNLIIARDIERDRVGGSAARIDFSGDLLED